MRASQRNRTFYYHGLIDVEASSAFALIQDGSAQVDLIDFRYTRSIRERRMRAQQRLQTVISRFLWLQRDRKQSALSPKRRARSVSNLQVGQLQGRAYQRRIKLNSHELEIPHGGFSKIQSHNYYMHHIYMQEGSSLSYCVDLHNEMHNSLYNSYSQI